MMKEHPYEFGGILFTIAVLGGILGGVAYDNFAEYEYDKSSGDSGGSTMDKLEKYLPIPKPTWNDYYKENMDMQLDCKKTSADLQEFYDCVNG